jgi:hypothetical protein
MTCEVPYKNEELGTNKGVKAKRFYLLLVVMLLLVFQIICIAIVIGISFYVR